jgi:hypothetical protein
MATKSPKDFLQDKQSLESNYNSHISLLRGQGFLWYMALMRTQIHINVLYICSKINYPSGSQEFRELLKEVQLNDNKDNVLLMSSLPMGLIINFLVMLPVRLESAPPLANLLATTMSI